MAKRVVGGLFSIAIIAVIAVGYMLYNGYRYNLDGKEVKTVALAEACTSGAAYVEVTGNLYAPDKISCTSGGLNGDSCTINLQDGKTSVKTKFLTTSKENVANKMKKVNIYIAAPTIYGNNGQAVKYANVKVAGMLENTKDGCELLALKVENI
jgi:hypothetical protein